MNRCSKKCFAVAGSFRFAKLVAVFVFMTSAAIQTDADAQMMTLTPNIDLESLNVNDNFEIAVELDGLSPQQSIEYFAMQIAYDPTHLILGAVSAGSDLPDAAAFTAATFPGSVEPIYDTLFGAANSSITSNGQVAFFDFEVISAGESSIEFSFLDAAGIESGTPFREVEADGFLRVFSVDPVIVTGDFNMNRLIDVGDIDLLSGEVRAETNDETFDLNSDNLVNAADRVVWIEDIAMTVPGDTDLNGGVVFADFLALSSSFGGAGGWADGDFDGDGEVGFPDFLFLSRNFGRVARAEAVPEPNSIWLAIWLMVLLLVRKRM